MTLKQIKQNTSDHIKQPLITGFHINQDHKQQILQQILYFLFQQAKLNNDKGNSFMGLCVTLTAMLLGFFAYLGFQNPPQQYKTHGKTSEISIQNNSNATGGKATNEVTNKNIPLKPLPVTTTDLESGS